MLKSNQKCAAYWPRSTPSSTVDYNDRLVSCYTLFTNPVPSNEDQINFVFCHGSQCTKEVFYFHIELLYQALGPKLGQCITVDTVTHGDSAVENHLKIGTFAAWDDVARDLGLVVHDAIDNHGLKGHNVFVGHSMGGTCGMVLATFEPSLFDCIIPLDPIQAITDSIGPAIAGQMNIVKWSSRGKDTFKSWEDYEKYYRQRFCKTWDKRVVDHFAPAAGIEMPDHTARTKANIANQMTAYLSSNPLYGAQDSLFKFLRVPTLIVYGSEFGKLSASNPSVLADIVQNGKALAISGGHNFPFEMPEETVKIIVPFVLANIAPKWHRDPKNSEEARKWQFEELKRTTELREWYMENEWFGKKMPRL